MYHRFWILSHQSDFVRKGKWANGQATDVSQPVSAMSPLLMGVMMMGSPRHVKLEAGPLWNVARVEETTKSNALGQRNS